MKLPPSIKTMITKRVRSGKYPSPEAVIAAAVHSLEQQERLAEFAPGELDALIEEGERDIQNGEVLDADEVFAELKRLSAERRRRGKKVG